MGAEAEGGELAGGGEAEVHRRSRAVEAHRHRSPSPSSSFTSSSSKPISVRCCTAHARARPSTVMICSATHAVDPAPSPTIWRGTESSLQLGIARSFGHEKGLRKADLGRTSA